LKKLLIISYYFPPAGGGGVQRITKFVKYLRQYGWQSEIITADENSYIENDFTLIDDLYNDIVIHRIPSLLSKRFSSQIRSRYNVPWPWDSPRSRSRDLLLILVRNFRNLLLIPDSQIFWILNILPKLSNIVSRFKPQAVFVSAPPFSGFLIGIIIKIKYRIPLIIDYRDPWTQLFESYRNYEYPLRKKLEIWLEKMSIKKADAIVVTTKQIKMYVQKFKPNPMILHVLTNGYDPQDYMGVWPFKFPKFSIVYTGKVTPYEYSAVAFLKGLSIVFDENPGLKDYVEVHFFGTFNDPASEYLIDKNQLGDIVSIHGYIEHNELLKFQLGADVLLLLLNEGYTDKYILLGKLFEYIFTCKPILSIIPRTSPMIDILKDVGQSRIISPENTIKISQTIIDLKKNSAVKKTNKRSIEQYDRQNITEKLAAIIDKITDKGFMNYASNKT
jgi:glycosyltransferase involved in cell wall biosynthesis